MLRLLWSSEFGVCGVNTHARKVTRTCASVCADLSRRVHKKRQVVAFGEGLKKGSKGLKSELRFGFGVYTFIFSLCVWACLCVCRVYYLKFSILSNYRASGSYKINPERSHIPFICFLPVVTFYIMSTISKQVHWYNPQTLIRFYYFYVYSLYVYNSLQFCQNT